MIQKSFAAISLILVAIGVTYLWAQESNIPTPKPQVEYRVMSLWEMFEGDVEAERRVKELSVTIRTTEKVRTRRTDMDAQDYQKALNTIANDGWELVTVNKSNYWIFKRVR